jgi:hypothetical protein
MSEPLNPATPDALSESIVSTDRFRLGVEVPESSPTLDRINSVKGSTDERRV